MATYYCNNVHYSHPCPYTRTPTLRFDLSTPLQQPKTLAQVFQSSAKESAAKSGRPKDDGEEEAAAKSHRPPKPTPAIVRGVHLDASVGSSGKAAAAGVQEGKAGADGEGKEDTHEGKMVDPQGEKEKGFTSWYLLSFNRSLCRWSSSTVALPPSCDGLMRAIRPGSLDGRSRHLPDTTRATGLSTVQSTPPESTQTKPTAPVEHPASIPPFRTRGCRQHNRAFVA